MRYHPFSFGQEKNMVLFLFLGPSSRLFLASSVPRRFFFLLGTSPHFERPFLFPKKLPKDRRQPVQKDLVPESISMCAGLFFATAQPDKDSGGGGVGGLVYIMEDVLLGLCLSSRWNEEIGNDSRSVM